MNLSLSPKKVIRVLIIIVCAIAIISLLGQFYKFFLFDGKERYLVNFFSLDKEFNIPTWYQAISELMCSLLMVIIFMAAKVENDRFKYHWLGLSFIFLLIATDEMLVLHEQIISPLRRFLGTGGFLYMAWIIPAIILKNVLFPDPFGPTITFIAFSNGISVFLAKDLNPLIIIFFT